MADLYLVRHGQTKLNEENKIRGWKDVPLDAQGKEEAQQLATYFQDHDVVLVITSDLSRATETADTIAEEHNLPVKDDKHWRPWDLGEWSGEDAESIVDDMLACVDNDGKCPPGGEVFSRFRERVQQGLDDAMRYAARAQGECVIVVTHVRCVRMVLDLLEGDESLTYIKQEADPVDPGGIVQVTEDGAWEIVEH